MGSDDGKSRDGLFGQSVRGVLWSAVERGGSAVISTGVQITLVRILAPEAFGLVAMAYVAINLLSLLKDQGFEAAIIQRERLEAAHLDSALWALLFASVLLTGIGVASAPLLARFFGEPRLTEVLMALMLTIPLLSAQSVPSAILQRKMEFKPLSVRTLFASAVGGVVAVIMAVKGFGVWSLVAKTLVHNAVGLVVTWTAARWWPRLRFSRAHFADLFAYGLNVTVERLVNYVNRNLDDILIGYFLGPTALGFYTVAYDILKGMTSILSRTFASVALPTFSRLQSHPEELRRAFLGSVQTIGLVAFPVFAAFVAVAPDLFATLYGDQWTDSVPVAQVLAFIGILHSVALLNGPLLKACNKPGWSLGLTAVNAAGNAVAFSIAVHYGIVWVAGAYVIRGYLHLPLTLSYVARLTAMTARDYLREVAFPVLGAVVAFGGAYGVARLRPEGWPPALPLALEILAAAALYGGFVWLALPQRGRDVIQKVRAELRPKR